MVSASSQFNTTIWNPYSVFNSNTAYGWISKTVLIKQILENMGQSPRLWSLVIHIWRMDSNQNAVLQRRRVVRGVHFSTNNLNCSVFSLVGSINGSDWFTAQTRTTPPPTIPAVYRGTPGL
jgi:hypothetical protein